MYVILNDELYHHGIKGQRWGVRRFQNADGSLKPAGEKRYGSGSKKEEKEARKREGINEYSKVMDSYNRDMKKSDEVWEKAKAEYDSLGPNRISKIKEVHKAHNGEGSAAAKKYLDLYDKSTKLADDAYDRKMEAESRLGKSVVKAYNKETKRAEKSAKAEAKKQQKAVKDFEKKVNKNWVKTYNKATKQFNVDIQKLNSNPKYSSSKLNDPKVHKAYMKEVSNLWKKLYSDQMKKDFGDHPDSKAKDWQSSVPFYNNYD